MLILANNFAKDCIVEKSKKLSILASAFVLVTSVFAADIAFADKGKPLNAGRDGLKSNAGGGNGTEGQVGETTSVETMSFTVTYKDDVTTGEPVVVATTTSTVETGRQVQSTALIGCGKGKACNLQTTYLVAYDVITTVGTETTVTTQTVEVTETVKTTTATTDIYDIDPGRSQPVNQAPEGEPEDIVVVTVSDPVVTEAPVGEPTTAVIEDSTSSVTDTITDEVKVTTPCNNDQCS
jgi:hypothetical protein